MSEYDIGKFLNEFAERTTSNLKHIEEINIHPNGYTIDCQTTKVYEVTQLINSLFGLICLPFEAYKRDINNSTFRTLSEYDYNQITKLIDSCKEKRKYYSSYSHERHHNEFTVSDFIGHIRNSISHGGENGIHFFPIHEKGNISGIIFYDKRINKDHNIRQEVCEFCIELTIEELKELMFNISNLYCKYELAANKQSKYNSEIKKLRKLMERGKTGAPLKTIFENP